MAESERLDVHLVRLGYAPSRRAARSLIERGLVRVNGRPGRKGALVAAGDNVEVEHRLEAAGIEPNPELPLEVLFDDDSLLVINKPGLMPCHPIRAGERNTVMNAVVARFAETADAGDQAREGGLVHRLDNGTSGCLIVARTPQSFAGLREAIRTGAIDRRYQALVAGSLKAPTTLEAPIAHHPRNPRKMVALDESESRAARGARPALTMVEPVARTADFTLVSVIPRTGSRHQIRVHLASCGHPIAGDTLYGGPELPTLAPGRFWLHLRALELDSPASGRIKVEAPLPADLIDSLKLVKLAGVPARS